MNTSRLPVLALALLFAAGCYYAAFGAISLLAGALVGYRLWWLELLVAGFCAWFGIVIFGFLERRQLAKPALESNERAIWRLAYRKGWSLKLEEIVNSTLLDEASALEALQSLASKVQAKLEPDGSWTLLDQTPGAANSALRNS
jgi:hypothetical protein